MGSGGVAIAALPTVICLKVPFSDGLGGEYSLYTKFHLSDTTKQQKPRTQNHFSSNLINISVTYLLIIQKRLSQNVTMSYITYLP